MLIDQRLSFFPFFVGMLIGYEWDMPSKWPSKGTRDDQPSNFFRDPDFFSDKAREFELVNGAECDGLRSRIGFILKQT